MSNYNLGKIYKIYSPSSGLTYYGSTYQKYLSRRIASHSSKFNKNKHGLTDYYCSSFEVLEYDDWKYELIKDFPCKNHYELTAEESNYILNNNCVNINIPNKNQRRLYRVNKKYC